MSTLCQTRQEQYFILELLQISMPEHMGIKIMKAAAIP